MVIAHDKLGIEGLKLDVQALLYPLMVIASVGVIVFSLVGIATVSGVMPSALLSSSDSEAVTSAADDQRGDANGHIGAFGCAECGVIESMRKDTESRSSDSAQ